MPCRYCWVTFVCSCYYATDMPEDVPRMIVCAEVVGVGCLSLIAAYVMRGESGAHVTDTLLLATLLPDFCQLV